MPTDRAPFEKFKVIAGPYDGTYEVRVQPEPFGTTFVLTEWDALKGAQRQFIESAIREKLERCAHAD
jgi:hypothetical protein